MALSLADHLALIEAEYAEALAHPLSARQLNLVAVLIDKFADRLFYARRGTSEAVFFAKDILAFRAHLVADSPALGLIFSLCAIPPRSTLVTQAVAVPLADYPALSIEDFMVSLYNGNAVQRVLLVGSDGTERLAHEVLGEAAAAMRAFTADRWH